MSELILLGDEAVARGAIDAGLSAAFAYPGTPSTEIYQAIEDYAKKHGHHVRGMWSTNEKVALEEGVGVSYAGRRAMVSMKHVGLNVAADPFMNVAVSGAHGGLVVVVADDPGMHSSQNEQDSRFFADFAMVPCFEPADQQQCYDMTREAFEVSETHQVPVLLRLVTRLAHSRSRVKLAAQRAQNVAHFVDDPRRFILLPGNARKAYASLIDKQTALQAYGESSAINPLTLRGDKCPGILVSGLAWNYLQEALGTGLEQYNLLRIGFYPLPIKKIRQLLDASSEIFVVEEGYPFIERYVSALGLMTDRPIRGKLTGHLPRMGELSQDDIKRCFGLPINPSLKIAGLEDVLVGRPPSLCDKCPHTDSYLAINEVIAEFNPDARVMGDIGCYTLGAMGPLQGIHSCLCMGASIGMAIGVVHAGISPALCVIGDGTFTHSGMTALLDAARDNTNIKVFILDNSIIAMTGGQPTAATDEEVVDLVAGLGVPRAHIRIVVPSPHKKQHTTETIRQELAYVGLSVIVARRACVTYAKEVKLQKENRANKHTIEVVSV
ncbi:thiamine pyrophosphate-dependent enzyme [Rhodoferax sp.]|uniref:thiamine pyrophosphate-dependent enzyme n=1 Tax=Rhodoferax sp. TaxID=50421 RepID=UPI0026019168|nr:thiamine pyrophosphate-dependent enzyme [Rhodoferax sp.]MDD5478179.1 thiamine pyrophosphate-dependent enzyme [Rhodoferax sp.]